MGKAVWIVEMGINKYLENKNEHTYLENKIGHGYLENRMGIVIWKTEMGIVIWKTGTSIKKDYKYFVHLYKHYLLYSGVKTWFIIQGKYKLSM